MFKNIFKRRDFLKTIGFGTTALAFPGILTSKTQSTTRPNIIFIMTDDHASHAISCYGSVINQTPNIDRLANEGMRFNNCFCTNAICAPSRAVILTGKYSHVNGVLDNRTVFDGSQQTLPKLLQKAGYQTAMIGKWHLRSDPTGFDYWNILPGQGNYYNPDFIEMGERSQHEGYVTDLITDFTIQWLENRNKAVPFFLMYHHKAPHRNWMPGPKHLTLYDNTEIPQPTTLFDDYKSRSRAAKEQEMTIDHHFFEDWDLKLNDPKHDNEQIKQLWQNARRRMTDEQRKAWDQAYEPKNKKFRALNLSGKELVGWKYQRYIKDYLRTIASVDDNIGRLLNHLDSTGLAENSIVVYTSDQGFFLGDHGWYDKRFMYEESLGMPFLVRYPKEIAPGSVNENLVLNLDFAPTFLDFAGGEIPGDMQGESLRKNLQEQTIEHWRTAIYYHYYEFPASHMVKKHYGIRTRKFKLIRFYDDIDAWELYDLENDPKELNNLYGEPGFADIIAELKSEIIHLQKKYGDRIESG